MSEVPRRLLADYFGKDPRLVKAFEEQAAAIDGANEAVANTAAATDAMRDATVIVLSANGEFTNERQLLAFDGIKAEDTSSHVRLRVDSSVARSKGGVPTFVVNATDTYFLPFGGTLVTEDSEGELTNKTLVAPVISGLVGAANDTAAATAGVPVGGIYQASGALRIRLA